MPLRVSFLWDPTVSGLFKFDRSSLATRALLPATTTRPQSTDIRLDKPYTDSISVVTLDIWERL